MRKMMQMHLEGPWIVTLYRLQSVAENIVRLLEALWESKRECKTLRQCKGHTEP